MIMPLLIHLNSKIALKNTSADVHRRISALSAGKCKKEVFYEITDYLNTNLVLFCFDNVYYLLGPYVKILFHHRKCRNY